MPLATKNNALIVKDGKVAEGCGCCGGPCKCDATAVTVSISASNFVRHLFLQNSFGAQSRISLGFIAAPSNGVWVLRKDTVDATAGVSASKWVSDAVPSPGSGRITAVVYRPSETSPARVTVGIPVWYWRSTGSAFKSLDEMIAESNAGGVVAQGFGTLVVELQCDSQSGTSRVLSLRPAIPESQWSPDGSTLPLLACDFTDANGIARTGGSVWWEGERLLKGQERLLSPQFGFSIISDTRTGNNIVTLNSVNLLCCEDEQDGACCEGTTCSVKPACQCQGTGKSFKGVGTTCTPNPCTCVPGGCADFTVTVNGLTRVVSIAGNPTFSTKSIYQIGTTQCGGNAYVSAWCEEGTLVNYPLGGTCDNHAVRRRRIVFEVRVSHGCAPINFQGGCVGIWELDFVFDKYDQTTGVPLNPPCLVAGKRRPRFGTPADCASCQQFIDCTAESISASVLASCNPLP